MKRINNEKESKGLEILTPNKIITTLPSVTCTDNVNRRSKKLSFENNAPFKSCISKINNTFIDNAKVLDIIMLMHNLLEYSNN